jgi:hypothetical protein
MMTENGGPPMIIDGWLKLLTFHIMYQGNLYSTLPAPSQEGGLHSLSTVLYRSRVKSTNLIDSS